VDDPSQGSPDVGSQRQSPPANVQSGSGEQGQDGEAGEDGEEAVKNQPYDEAVELSDDGDSVSPDEQEQELSNAGGAQHLGGRAGSDMGADSPPQGPDDPSSDTSSSESGSEDGSGTGMGFDDDGGQGAVFKGVEGGYDPKEFEDLEVAADIKDLFQYIARYQPHTIELEERIRPFIPDYIPSVGDIDAFIKVPRPDASQENLGLTVLDEPIYQQSDPTVIEMQLRHQSKQTGMGQAIVSTIENAEKQPKKIKSWVTSVSELHATKPPTEVIYSKPMPDIEGLMQVWDPQFEEMLGNCQLPNPSLDLNLEEYVRIVCAIFDIPVYQNSVESLHILFTLFSEFKNNSHFQQDLMRANETTSQMQQEPLGMMG